MARNSILKESPGCDRGATVDVPHASISLLRKAARDTAPVTGLTHAFYRYPARFSPSFVGSAIDLFSEPGDLILDPYMGGGTAIVEAYARGRAVVGCDLNSLAVFVTRAKVTTLHE